MHTLCALLFLPADREVWKGMMLLSGLPVRLDICAAAEQCHLMTFNSLSTSRLLCYIVGFPCKTQLLILSLNSLVLKVFPRCSTGEPWGSCNTAAV